MAYLWTVFYWGVFLVFGTVNLCIAAVIFVLTFWWDKRRRISHLFSCYWGYAICFFNPFWRIRYSGRHKLDGRPAMLVANHSSMADICLLFGLWSHFKFVAKASVVKAPIIGWNYRLAGYIYFRRDDRRAMVQMMRDCEAALKGGSAILIFPEGTRSPDGKIQPFKPGGFQIALRNKVPIIPIALEGTAQAFPRDGFMLRGVHRIKVTVLDPIPFERLEGRRTDEIAKEVHDLIAEAIGQPEMIEKPSSETAQAPAG